MKTVLVLNSLTRSELADWYSGLNYFSKCQIQSGFGYSNVAGLQVAIDRGETLQVKVDDLGNVWPTEVGVKEWQKP